MNPSGGHPSGNQSSRIWLQQVPQHHRRHRTSRAGFWRRRRDRQGREPRRDQALRCQSHPRRHDRREAGAQRRHSLARGSANLAEAGPDRVSESSDPASVLHGQRRGRQDFAFDRRRAHARGRGQESAAGQHRRRVEPRRDARDRASQHTRARARRPRLVGAEHRPRQRSRGVSPTGSGADGRGCQRRRTLDRARAAVWRLHHGDRIVRRILVPLVRRCRALRPHRLRHGTDGPHPALAQPAQGLDRIPGGQRSRRLLPWAAFGPEDAGGAVQGRARRSERSREDHRDPGDAARQGRHRRSGAHLRRVA